jgi:hypothetical protein
MHRADLSFPSILIPFLFVEFGTVDLVDCIEGARPYPVQSGHNRFYADLPSGSGTLPASTSVKANDVSSHRPVAITGRYAVTASEYRVSEQDVSEQNERAAHL